MKKLIFLLLLIIPLYLQAQDYSRLAYKYGMKSWDMFKELLSLPNDANYPEDIERNVRWCEKELMQRSFITQRFETGYVPLLLAERKISKEDAPTVLLYIHIDGQSVDPQFWFQEDPYTATLKQPGEEGGWEDISWEKIYGQPLPDWRIFARSASDDKGPFMMLLTALDAMKAEQMETPYHVKIILDFEEEKGSTHLPGAVEKNREALKADCMLIFDGPIHSSGRPTLTFGARGITTLTLTVYGPILPQHSGHFGNYVPNPALKIAQLLASMKDDAGRVIIEGFYDGIELDEETWEILNSVPDDINALRLRMGIAAPDSVASTYQASIQYPSLNIRGMASGWVGPESRTIVPATATAEIDIRLVVETDPDRLVRLIKEHIQKEGFFITSEKPSSRERLTYPKICRLEVNEATLAYRTDPNSLAGKWLERALIKAHGMEVVKIRTSGGTVPISPFVQTLDIPAISIPTVNPDNNQHSPNENLRIGNYFEGIRSMLAILTEPME